MSSVLPKYAKALQSKTLAQTPYNVNATTSQTTTTPAQKVAAFSNYANAKVQDKISTQTRNANATLQVTSIQTPCDVNATTSQKTTTPAQQVAAFSNYANAKVQDKISTQTRTANATSQETSTQKQTQQVAEVHPTENENTQKMRKRGGRNLKLRNQIYYRSQARRERHEWTGTDYTGQRWYDGTRGGRGRWVQRGRERMREYYNPKYYNPKTIVINNFYSN